jgi:hypothetical protein
LSCSAKVSLSSKVFEHFLQRNSYRGMAGPPFEPEDPSPMGTRK